MRDTTETRALNALWRNHPLTSVEDRWGARAHKLARQNRDMLLAWAAEQPDYRLMDCRNLGATTLAWIRANQSDAAVRPFVPIPPTSAIRDLMSRHADCTGECEIWAERDAILAVQHESAEAGYRAGLESVRHA